jgi:hypothetical protein
MTSTTAAHPAAAFEFARDPQAAHKGVLRIVRRFYMAERIAVVTVHFDYNGTTYSETLRVADVVLLGTWTAPVVVELVPDAELLECGIVAFPTGRTLYAATLENADRLSHVQSGFTSLDDLDAYAEARGLRIVLVQERPETRIANTFERNYFLRLHALAA